MTAILSSLNAFCALDESAINLLGADRDIYWFWRLFLPVFLTSGFLALWMTRFPTLRTHGFSRPVWNLVGWFVLAMALIQLAIGAAQLLLPSALPCGTSIAVPAALGILLCLAALVVHRWRGNKGTLAGFLVFVTAPAMFEAVAGSKVASVVVLQGLDLINRMLA